MRTLFTFALFVLTIYSISTYAQTSTSTTGITRIYGAVKSSDNKPAEFVTVALLRASDSVSVKGLTTDESGTFEFLKVKAGKYLLAISSFDYQRYTSQPFEIKANEIEKELNDIALTKAVKTLNEVTVTSTRPLIEQRLDKTVLNVENSIVSEGGTAIEVLQRAPGITVDNDGNVSLKGKQGVMILIDGKPSYLSGAELTEMLKSMSSSTISTVEIMTNPPAKYDAAGNAGIINIKLKKGSNSGFNGTFTGSFGRSEYSKGNTGINVNFRQKKFNLFGSYNYSNRVNMQNLELERNFYQENSSDLSHIIRQHASMNKPSNNNSIKAGIDLYLNAKNTLGFMVNGSIGTWESKNPTSAMQLNPNLQLNSTTFAQNRIAENWNNFTYNTNYKLNIDSSGKELTADVDFARNIYGSNQSYNTSFYDSEGKPDQDRPQIIQKGIIPSKATIIAAKTDYIHPLNKTLKFEAGLKTSFVTTKNAIDYFNQNVGSEWVHDISTSNKFDYKENINAAYINFNKEFKKLSIQLGLRAEQTRSQGYERHIELDGTTADSLVKRNYLQLFPTTFVKYELDKNNTLQASFSRRVERPDYENLNPFRNQIDPYTYQKGNPYLKPEISHIFEVSHVLKGKYTTTINYNRTVDVITEFTGKGDEENSVYVTKANLSTQDNYGVSFSIPVTFTNWWNANAYANAFYNRFKGVDVAGKLDRKGSGFNFNVQNSFTFGNGFKAELNGFYNSKMLYGQFDIAPIWMISAGIQKSILDKKGSIKLNVNDIFNSQQFHAKVKNAEMDLDIINKRDSRVATLSFSYRFGNTKMKTSQRNSTSSEDEKNRTKQGHD
ncbi:outer membrane beta-barrel protein [Solitalea lacus]|uniref:outer membrane beta-barrel protein n=1 Tax=Solitalea lacus TaxID=2911172 RepID=UPI001EDB511F|nr:outer membrane beta-barrel protein [Solitalea lacus]UKJ06863.1 TonB-dependent receptor [Solitalea lacus]